MSEIHVRTDFPRKTREIENCWIPMPDGTKLAARIWLPEDAEADPVPAILEYLPYRKRDGTVARDQLTHPYFAGHGYAGVRVDMRGTGDSEGVCLGEYLLQEQVDCLAVIDWLAAQPWCSGKVGMIGISWGGFNGLQLAARRPPALAAVITLCSTDDRYADDIHFMGGCLLTDKLAWGGTAFNIANTPPDPAIVGPRWREMWLERIEQNGLWMLDWFRHQRRDDFYAHGSVCEDYSDIEIPIYAVGGWEDGYPNAIFRLLENLPGPRKGLVGPWGHKYPHFARPAPRIGFLQECLRWWDQHLKGIETGIMDEPMLRAWINEPFAPDGDYSDRQGRWVAEPGWSGAARDSRMLYLSEGALADTPGTDPIPVASPETAGWTAGTWCGYGAVPDRALDQTGEAGLMTAFETPPMKEEMELLGFPVFEAEITSATPQANLAVTLSLVAPDGRATLLSYGVLNLNHRKSHAAPEPMPAGNAEPVAVHLNVCGQHIPRGHRIRLALSSAYWPVIWPSRQPADLVIHPGSARIVLPLRPPRAMDADLLPFQPSESAEPLVSTTHGDGFYRRDRHIDMLTGIETNERESDTGLETHPHTGLTLQSTNTDSFRIHPDDPNSATGTSRWRQSYARGDWLAELETTVTVTASRDVWRIEANLVARDAEGLVAERNWAEDIPRDMV
ncbi:CocE/NonD family hydrolase [Tropicimonas sp. TH_r6]|uniref:CocE/NonD family hydrolase n=1 Tax=Tropicimonas sp. TH_r6 TaxID=3082085 RepID=UPI0029530796|nr:CocE/NonD family hydrolase [Tropicimonas sp. TH_r6]MDV7144837.1 CocE/NonD family hydrolase [Tropicimonas sp. TH_r6]